MINLVRRHDVSIVSVSRQTQLGNAQAVIKPSWRSSDHHEIHWRRSTAIFVPSAIRIRSTVDWLEPWSLFPRFLVLVCNRQIIEFVIDCFLRIQNGLALIVAHSHHLLLIWVKKLVIKVLSLLKPWLLDQFEGCVSTGLRKLSVIYVVRVQVLIILFNNYIITRLNKGRIVCMSL